MTKKKKEEQEPKATDPPWVSVPKMMKGKRTPQKAVGVGLFLLFAIAVPMVTFLTGWYVLLGLFLGFLGAVSTFVGFGLWLGLFTEEEVREYFRKIARDIWKERNS